MKVEFVSLFPTLRFPGFESQSEVFELGKITNVIDCKHRTPEYVEEGVPIVSPGSIEWGEIDLVSPTKRVTEGEYESLMDHCEPSVGDLVLSRNQSLGIASHIASNEKFVLGQDTVLIKQKNGNGMLIFHRLQTAGTQNIISRLSGGSTFSRINLKDIRLLPLPLPTEEKEQQKIADFLTAVDGRIGQLIQKKAWLTDYKKGVMQQLFTQAIRFKDNRGNDFPDWEEKKLGEIARAYQPQTLAQTQFREGGEYPVYGANGLIGYHDEYNHDEEQVTVACRGTCGKVNMIPERSWINGNAMVIALKPRSSTTKAFVYYALSSSDLRYLITGSSQPQITGDIKFHNIALPAPDEQTKIADFLSAIDRKIECVATQITETQNFKRGLLQQMFV